MFDAHCHLNDPRLLPQIDTLLAHMRQADVQGALVVGYDVPSSREAVALARRYPALRAAVGVHPHDSRLLDAEGLAELAVLAAQPEVVAIGEIGLDYHYMHSPRAVQQEALRRQLALAAQHALPIVIHEREAAEDVMAILDAEAGWALGGTWHCCSVTPDLAVEIAPRLYLGIAGWVTFPKMTVVREVAEAVPLERLLIETDAPYLTPVPHRGHPNEPAYVALVAAALADVKTLPVPEIAAQTTANLSRAFPRWEIPVTLRKEDADGD